MMMSQLIERLKGQGSHKSTRMLAECLIATGPVNHLGETWSGSSVPADGGGQTWRFSCNIPAEDGVRDASTVEAPVIFDV